MNLLRDHHVPCLEFLITLEKCHLGRLSFIAVEQCAHIHPHTIAEVDRFRGGNGRNRRILRWCFRSDGNQADRGIENPEPTGRVLDASGRVVAAIGQHHHACQFFRRQLLQNRIQGACEIGRMIPTLSRCFTAPSGGASEKHFADPQTAGEIFFKL